MPFSAIRALTLDLDDTLWPIAPVIVRAERLMRQWLERHAPATAAANDAPTLRRIRAEVERDHPEWHHDLSALRLATLRRAVHAAGEPTQLAEQAFDVFFDARQQVELYPDALDALQRLARRFPLLSLSNGNADLQRVGVAQHFCGSLSAREVGIAKPDPRLFAAACARLGLPPAKVLHVGDDLALDVMGARAAGMPAVWLRRAGSATDLAALQRSGPAGCDHPARIDCHVVGDLAELVRRLGC